MNSDLLEDIAKAESKWASKVPDVSKSDNPEDEYKQRALAILGGESHDTIDALACRIADTSVAFGVTTENYQLAKDLAGAGKKMKSRVEHTRVEIKADSLKWGKAVDSTANEIKDSIDTLIGPILAGIKAIDDEKARIKAEKEEAARQAIIDAENERLEVERKAEAEKRAAEAEANRAEQARLMKEREALEEERRQHAAEQKRLNDELQEKLAKERAAFELEQKKANDLRLEEERKSKAIADAALAEERAKYEEERRVMAEQAAANNKRIQDELAERNRIDAELREQQRIEREKIERELADMRREKQAREDSERAQRERDAAENARKVAEAAEAARLEKMAPDVEKVKWFGKQVALVLEEAPDVVSDEAAAVLRRAIIDLSAIASDLGKFGN